jgi:hypothetical protein
MKHQIYFIKQVILLKPNKAIQNKEFQVLMLKINLKLMIINLYLKNHKLIFHSSILVFIF